MIPGQVSGFKIFLIAFKLVSEWNTGECEKGGGGGGVKEAERLNEWFFGFNLKKQERVRFRKYEYYSIVNRRVKSIAMPIVTAALQVHSREVLAVFPLTCVNEEAH